MSSRVVDGQGTEFRLGEKLGSGGEGQVHAVQGSGDVVAKILFPKGRTKELHDKIRAMIARQPPGAHQLVDGFPILTWPQRILYEGKPGRDRFVGYTMPRVHVQRDFVPLYQVFSASRRTQYGGKGLTWDRFVVLAIRLCHVVRTLHSMGYAVGDLNDRNILVSRKLTPLFLDTDSFEVPRGLMGHYPCRVGDRLYWPPELLGTDLGTYRGSRIPGDRYSLAVLLFQLFLNGMRPYQSRGRLVEHLDSLEKKTLAGLYPWSQRQRGKLEPPSGAPDYGNLPKSLRRGFEAAFVTGHKKPGRRPSADDWYRALKRINDEGFAQCVRHAVHRYARSLGSCPWCEDPHDPFGAPRTRPSRSPRSSWTPRSAAPSLARPPWSRWRTIRNAP